MTRTTPIPFRLENEVIERLDRVAAALAERAGGAKVTRASAHRVAIDRGLALLESELGLGTRKPKPKRK